MAYQSAADPYLSAILSDVAGVRGARAAQQPQAFSDFLSQALGQATAGGYGSSSLSASAQLGVGRAQDTASLGLSGALAQPQIDAYLYSGGLVGNDLNRQLQLALSRARGFASRSGPISSRSSIIPRTAAQVQQDEQRRGYQNAINNLLSANANSLGSVAGGVSGGDAYALGANASLARIYGGMINPGFNAF